MNILAMEVSTSSAKAIVYSTNKGIVDAVSIPYKQSVSDVVSQHPEGIYKAAIECAKAVLEKTDCSIDIIGLGCTWHSILFMDRDKNPMGRIMTWANTDAAGTVQEYRRDEKLRCWLYQRTGCVIHSIYPLWKWMYMKHKEKGAFDSQGFISSQPEYVFNRLTGEWGVSQSVASGTGFMNIHSLDWDEEILEFAGIKRHQLSPLREPEYTAPLLKEAADMLGLPAGIPVVIIGPDGALNQIGSGAMESGIMTMSVGTSGAVRIAYDSPVLPDNPSTWCYYAAEGKRLAGAATSGAGNCVEWFAKKLNRNTMSYAALDKLICDMGNYEIQFKDAPVFLPFLYGERCPGWQDMRGGGYHELKGYHETGHLYYAVLEGVLFNIYQCYKILVQVGEVPRQIRISGGIENSRDWLQMAADIFQREIYTSNIEHASTMGAIALALKAAGRLSSVKQFQPELGEKIAPNPEMIDFYRQRFEKYMECYQKHRNEVSRFG